MRTLNKTLALVLAVVMLFGMLGTASAANFTDDAKVQYKEAVDVMTGIGAINGMGDGTFNPAGNLTRAQAAKLVAYTVLGADVAKILPVKASSFKDVDANFAWANPSIEYLVGIGAINGMGDGTFNPAGNVTGHQLAKMLLVALDVKGEFTGASWELNTAIAANKAGVFKGSKAASFSAAATREEAALYCFNALFFSPTGATNEKIWGITEWDGNNKPVYGWIEVPTAAAGSIAATVYPTLKSATSNDTYGRPALVWTYKNKAISQTATSAPVQTYTAAVKPAAIKLALDNAGYTVSATADVVVYTNGVPETVTANDVATYADDKTDVGKTAVGGNGCLVEVYVTSAGVLDRLVVVNTHLATLATVTPDTASTTTVDERALTLTAVNGTTITAKPATTTGFDAAYAAAVAAKAANKPLALLVVPKNDLTAAGDALSLTIPTTVTGKATKVTSANVYTVDGKDYKLSYTANIGTGVVPGANCTFVLDTYGHIISATTVTAAAPNYLYLVQAADAWVLNGTALQQSIVADVVKADGTTAKATIAKVGTAAPVNAAAVANGLYTFTVNTKGTYELTAVTAAADTSLSPKNPAIVAGSKYANNLTKFVILNWTTDATPVYAGTVNVVTGYANIPAMSTVVGSYIDADNNGVVETVFVRTKAAVASAVNYAFYTGTWTYDGTNHAYDFIVNGAKTTINNVTKLPAKGLVSIDSSNSATAINFASDVEFAITPTATDGIYGANALSFDNGLVKVAGTYKTAAAATVPVYVFDSATSTFETKTLADFTTAVTGNIVIAQNGTAVSAVYLIK